MHLQCSSVLIPCFVRPVRYSEPFVIGQTGRHADRQFVNVLDPACYAVRFPLNPFDRPVASQSKGSGQGKMPRRTDTPL